MDNPKGRIAPLLILVTIFIFPLIHAQTINTGVQVQNSPPVASSAQINGGSAISLTEGTTTEIIGTVTITDNNGCTEINTVESVLYRSGVGSGASDDTNNHYAISCVSNSDCAGVSDLDETYTCTYDIEYFADPTDVGSIYESENWVFIVTPSDVATGTPSNDTVELDTLTGLEVSENSIDYGLLQLGTDTNTTNQNITVRNTGNEGIDVSLDGFGSSDGDGYSMVCMSGNIPLSYEKYSNVTFNYVAGIDLTDAATDLNMNIAQRITSDSNKSIYWGFGMPPSGAGGTCTGNIQVLAVSDPDLRN